MASIFNGLHIGYSGLTASQLGINTTGHNISNAESEGYTRQRVVQQSTIPLGTIQPGAQGNGTQVKEITRIHDEFVFGRFRSESENKEFSDFTRQTFEELSTYFPEIENVGIKYDMQEYFNLWGDLSIHPDNQAIKVALAQQTQVFSQDVQETRNQISELQNTLNDQLELAVNDINEIALQISNLNAAITKTESIEGQHANDLRDQRGTLEIALSKLVDATIFEGNLSSNMATSRDIVEKGGDYTINIAGFNIVDGKSFHPIHLESNDNPQGFHSLSYERQDGALMPMGDFINGGRVGAILDLRGTSFDADGKLENGQLQEIINQLDGFATGLIEATNNIYAQGSKTSMRSDLISYSPLDEFAKGDINIAQGNFDINIYDPDGNIVASRTININQSTTMDNGTAQSIIGQIGLNLDDNLDSNATNDVDDILVAAYGYDGNTGQGALNLEINLADFPGYTFGIVDQTPTGSSIGTNFAGALGLSRYFEGNDAKNINLESSLQKDPALIKPNKSPIEGDNSLATDMLQLQFDKIKFNANGVDVEQSVYGYYDALVTDVGTRTNAAITVNDTSNAKYNAVLLSYESISKVNIDEEMVNLIKYQTAYGASAKIITTIDQMMDTLLGLKR